LYYRAVADESTITSVSLGRGLRDKDQGRSRPQLVLVVGCDDPTLTPARHLIDDVDLVRFGRGARGAERGVVEGLACLTLKVPDRRMSSDHGTLRRTEGRWVLDDPSSKNGAVVNGALTRRAILADGDLLELGHTFFLFRDAPAPPAAKLDALATELGAPLPQLTTFVAGLERDFAGLARVAATPGVSVVLLGETGTGKEVVARALHQLSGRSGQFVAVNCGALPETLVEAELFGYRRGAFSGANTDRPGLVRSADGGTLFLDEFAELPGASQAAFLRVLQEQEVVPVGDVKPVKVDARLCAATLRDIEKLVDSGLFRADLYARLFGLVVELPPLRRRREDLGLLIQALLQRIPGGSGARFTPAAMRALLMHDWPFNVRELEKSLTTALALAGEEVVELEHLPPALRRGPRLRGAEAEPPPGGAADDEPERPDRPLDDEEQALRARLVELLTRHQGNVAAVGRELGKERMQIHRWVKRFGIDLASFRPGRD
jgi:transcriptional regulator with AAA-type ATPase domain